MMNDGIRMNGWGRRAFSLGAYTLVGSALAMLAQGCGMPAPNGDWPDDDTTHADIAREIEEADIVKLEEGYFYLANTYTGLRIIDARNMDDLVMMGGLALGGRGVELFVRDDLAFVFTAADFLRCAGEPVGFGADQFRQVSLPDYEGSRLWVVDVSDKAAPALVTQFDFDGFVTATRRVGDVIYVAGNLSTNLDEYGGGAGVFVTSINVADPENVAMVDTETFVGTSLDMHVSSEAIFVVGNDPELSDTTLVSYVDISDASGEIVPRDQFRVPGLVQNRFFVDEYDGAFRIVTEEFAWERVVALYTYDVSNPDDIDRLARLPIVTDEDLRAVRFDGSRGYAVTFRIVDPLFVLDLADPVNPQISGELEVPGYSTHLVPLGDRLVGVGFDDTMGFRPAIALYDVSDPSDPWRLSRIILGERGTETISEATVDEKALRVIQEAGLILLPFSMFDDEVGRWVDSLQLIELETNRLLERGTVDHRGLVRRAGLLDERVWVLSDVAIQSVNIDDLDELVSLSTLDIINEQELLDAGLLNCADSARFRGTDIDWMFVDSCGSIDWLTLFLMGMGLCAMRVVKGRP